MFPNGCERKALGEERSLPIQLFWSPTFWWAQRHNSACHIRTSEKPWSKSPFVYFTQPPSNWPIGQYKGREVIGCFWEALMHYSILALNDTLQTGHSKGKTPVLSERPKVSHSMARQGRMGMDTRTWAKITHYWEISLSSNSSHISSISCHYT